IRVRSPSTTLTLTCRVSPGSKSGISLPAESFATCSFSSRSIKFIAISPSAAPVNAGRTSAYVSGCAGFYAKPPNLSPFRHGLSRGLLGLAPLVCIPQIGAPFARYPLRLGAPPVRHLGVVARQEHIRDRTAFEHLRARELGILQEP